MARRLVEAQRHLGHQATLISTIDGTLYDAPLAKPMHTLAAALDHYVVKRADFHAPVSLYRNRLHRQLNKELEDVDILHIHWPHGLVDMNRLSDIAQGRPVVWTLHDMAVLTGGPHYALGCTSHRVDHSTCSAVRRPWQEAVETSRRELADCLHRIEHLGLVSPSQWLADEAAKSRSLHDLNVQVIPNPLGTTQLSPIDQGVARTDFGIPHDHTVFVVSASNLEDPVKAVAVAVDAFAKAFTEDDPATLLLVGRGSMPSGSMPSGRSNVRQLGYLEAATMARVLAASDYLLVSSLAENQPLAISEAQAAGVSLIARNDTGLPEHTVYDSDARLFSTGDELLEILKEVAVGPRSESSRSALSATAQDRFDPTRITEQYVEAYRSLQSG